MKGVKLFGFFFVMMFLFSFVIAASSEVVADFSVDVIKKPVTNYIPVEKFVGDFFVYFLLILIALVFVYFVIKSMKDSKKKAPVHKKKVSVHKKKASKKKVKVLASSRKKRVSRKTKK